MIGAYHAVYFEDVGSAVGFCHDLVPHVAPMATRPLSDDARPVVWFHVPRRSLESERPGCYLLLSSGAVHVAREVGLDAPVSGIISRSALPPDAVLVLGEDRTEQQVESRAASLAAPSTPRATVSAENLVTAPS